MPSTDQAFTALGETVEVGVFDRIESVAYLRRRTGLPDGTPRRPADSTAAGK